MYVMKVVEDLKKYESHKRETLVTSLIAKTVFLEIMTFTPDSSFVKTGSNIEQGTKDRLM